MRIAIDMRRPGEFGVGTYMRNIVRSLARMDAPGKSGPGNIYTLIGSHERLREFRGLPPNFKLQPFPKTAAALRHTLGFRRLLAEAHCQLLHVPHMYKTPRLAPCPVVMTVHDMLGFLYKSGRSPAESRFRFELARWALRNAARIIAVSNSAASDLHRVFGGAVRPSKVDVIYNAIDERLLQPVTAEDRRHLAERYQVHSPYLLYAGTIRPHKNLVRVIEAFSALKNELRKSGQIPELKLLVIGDDVSSHPEIRRAVLKSHVTADVRFLGFVPTESLRTFYAAAELFVFPSLYEGFGLPPLEAMAQGTPVVTSNASSLPEVVGNAAVLVNPENVFDIMHGMHRALVDQELRAELRERGFARAERYSWDESAMQILTTYEKAVSGGAATRA